MVRGTGKFKTKRGGGRNFSRDMVLNPDGIAEPASRRKNAYQGDDDDDDEEEDEDALKEEDDDDDDDSEGEEDVVGQSATAKPELTRAERRELKKKQTAQKQAQKQGIDEDEEDADLINPNHVEKKLNISDLGSPELTRRERDAKDKKAAEDRYWKRHLAGQTDKAKTDLARLRKVRAEREAAEAKRKAEAEAKAAEVEAKKKAAVGGKRI